MQEGIFYTFVFVLKDRVEHLFCLARFDQKSDKHKCFVRNLEIFVHETLKGFTDNSGLSRRTSSVAHAKFVPCFHYPLPRVCPVKIETEQSACRSRTNFAGWIGT